MKINLGHFILLSVGIHLLMLIGFKYNESSNRLTNYSKNLSTQSVLKTSLYLKTKKQEFVKAVKIEDKSTKKVAKPKNDIKQISELEVAKTASDKSSGADTALNKYLSDLRLLVQKNKKYPRIAKKLKQSGVVVLYFEIEKTNKIKKLELSKASEFESLNEAALEAVNGANLSSLNFPEDLREQTLKVAIPVQFDLL